MSFQFDRKVKVAAVQHGPVLKDAPDWFDLDGTMDKAVRLIEEAGREGARLVVFPECWMPCFPYCSMDFSDEFIRVNPSRISTSLNTGLDIKQERKTVDKVK
ncbi:MAG: nitrilase-related carbon-nitrogen hydrolase [Dehalococcoidia bacterium]|nr:nitrilase-related carbon-nitrogen hydrolase [Dehalococcoidia bacterium]